MGIGRLAKMFCIRGWSDREAWMINHSGLSQEEKDRWNAIRALVLKK
ncbi:MAG: hypothetical protein LBD34_01150 [Puniceicoccales bacterium]|jgi:hypothetical protein|nr:hypothetical protein [Puniceicoccales bacterium]